MSSEQYLIQSLMWRQCVSEDHFKRLVAKSLNAVKVMANEERVEDKDVDKQVMDQLVMKLNKNIRPFHMQISRGSSESDGTAFYALINTADTELTRLSNQWSNKEILFYRKLVANIIESEESLISSTKALNIGREEELKFTISSSESLINKWVEQKWLEEVGDGNVAIGVRTLLELNLYIREHFEANDCFRCKALCIRGSSCMSCDTKLHFYCISSQFIPNNICPNCSKQWTNNSQLLSNGSVRGSAQPFDSNSGVHTLEEEDTEEEEEQQSSRRQRPKRSKRS